MNANIFQERKQQYEAEAANQELDMRDRIFALTQLYFLHQFDVHSQARYIRQIQDIVEGRA